MYIIVAILFFWVLYLSVEIKALNKKFIELGKWSAYLEDVIKNSGVLVSKDSKWEINPKIRNLLM